MNNVTPTRGFSIGMAIVNMLAALVLFSFARTNLIAGLESTIVAILAPILTLIFLLMAIGWGLDSLRPGVLRRFLCIRENRKEVLERYAPWKIETRHQRQKILQMEKKEQQRRQAMVRAS